MEPGEKEMVNTISDGGQYTVYKKERNRMSLLNTGAKLLNTGRQFEV